MDLFTKRDFDMLQYQRELMRKASLTAPPITLSGQDVTLVRRFAQESFTQMKAVYPDAFKDKTIDEWDKAIKAYLATRRPEFREDLLVQLRKRYGDSAQGRSESEEPNKVLASKSVEELQRKVAEVQADVMIELLDESAQYTTWEELAKVAKNADEDRGPSFIGTVLRGAGYGAAGGALMGALPAYQFYRHLKLPKTHFGQPANLGDPILSKGLPSGKAAIQALKALVAFSSGPTIAGTIGGMTAYPFIRKRDRDKSRGKR